MADVKAIIGTVKIIIGVVLFIFGIMCADSECLLVPTIFLFIGAVMAKDMVGTDDESREDM